MRKVLLFIAVAAAVQGAQAQTVKLISPTAINIPVSGTSADLRVFYQAPIETAVTITDVGTLISEKQVKATLANPQTQPASVLISVMLDAPLRPGESHSGALVFTPKTGDAVAFPVTISRAAPAFTATVEHTDICLECGEPREATIKITNSGSVPIAKIRVGTILMSDNGRRHRVIARAAGCKSEKPEEPCLEIAVLLAPGQSRTIAIPLTPPSKAGDYATTIELLADGAPTVTVSLVVRTRGPRGGTWVPFALFLVTLIAGTIAAYVLEWWFGSGGGDERAKAELSLDDSFTILGQLRDQIGNDSELTNTLRRITRDRASIALLQQQAPRRTPAELTAGAALFAVFAKKREQLWKYVGVARETQKQRWVPLLDAAPDIEGETEAAYETRLRDILDGPAPAGIVASSIAADDPDREATMKARADALRRKRRRFLAIRGAILFVLVFGTAMGMFYAKGCNFGSWADYFGLLVWTLGLTGAGAALVKQVPPRPA